MHFGLVVPVIIVIITNMSILILTLLTVYKAEKSVGDAKVSGTSSGTKMIKISMSCSCLMGFTWIFGILAWNEANVVFQWLFTISNSLQGFFIFLFHSVRNEDVKKEWRSFFLQRRKTFRSSTNNQISNAYQNFRLKTLKGQ